MSPFKFSLLGICTAAMLALVVSSVSAQYYVPLRYDLRMSGPQYPVVPAANPDPYAFGQTSAGNLGMTGNLRFGKSFQGPVPYNQNGSQLSGVTLPSLALSNFRRDSYGADDIGNVVPYATGLPYVPQTAQVTNSPMAQRPAFVRDPTTGAIRPTYLPQPAAPQTTAGTQAERQALLGLTGAPTTAGLPQNVFNTQGLTVSRETYQWINALIESGRETEKARPNPSAESSIQVPEDLRPSPPLPSYKFPGQQELEQLAQPQPALPELPGAEPQNLLTPVPPGYQPWERPQPSNVLNPKGPLPLPSTPEEAQPTPATPKPAAKGPALFGPTPTQPRPVPGQIAAPGTGPGPGQPATSAEGPEKPSAQDLLVAPIPNVGAKTYADYFNLGEKAMKEGRFDYAEGMFAAASALDRTKADALFGRVNAMLPGGRHVEAGFALGAALKAHPEWAKSIPDLKAAYPKSDQYDRIFEDLTADLEKSPASAVLQFMAGYVLYGGGQPAAARPHLEKAAALRGTTTGPEQVLLGAMK